MSSPNEMRTAAAAPITGFIDRSLVLLIAVMNADRVDLLAGAAPFRLTPFLLLAPIVLVGWVIVYKPVGEPPRRGSYRVSLFVLLQLCFIWLCIFSLLDSLDVERGAEVVALWTTILGLSSAVAGLILSRQVAARILERGAQGGILTCLFFDIAQVVGWFRGAEFDPLYPGSLTNIFAPQNIGGLIPRLTAVCIDANRGGFVLLMYWLLLLRFGDQRRLNRWLGRLVWLMLLFTLSRSAIAAGLGAAVMLFWEQKGRRLRLLTRTVAVLLVLSPLLLALQDQIDTAIVTGSAWSALTERADLQGQAAGEHLELLSTGMRHLTSSPKTLMLGLGMGSSPRVLSFMFPDNKYANFHSLYLSIAVEAGIITLGVILLLLFLPFLFGSFERPFVVAAAAFNVFYQSTADPIFWVVLALLWFLPLMRRYESVPARPVAVSAA